MFATKPTNKLICSCIISISSCLTLIFSPFTSFFSSSSWCSRDVPQSCCFRGGRVIRGRPNLCRAWPRGSADEDLWRECGVPRADPAPQRQAPPPQQAQPPAPGDHALRQVVAAAGAGAGAAVVALELPAGSQRRTVAAVAVAEATQGRRKAQDAGGQVRLIFAPRSTSTEKCLNVSFLLWINEQRDANSEAFDCKRVFQGIDDYRLSSLAVN